MTEYKRTLITSALPYVNNLPHLGTMVCVISADVFRRFLESKKEEVLGVLGTDDHGTTTETKALEEGITPKEIVEKYFNLQKKVYEWFNVMPQCFGQSSSEANKEITIDIFEKLDKNGYVKEQETEQLFCEKCDKYLADRFVEGTCPHCGYEEARGDQCEKCGELLDAIELVNPKCKVCKETPIPKKTMHLFIDLPKISPKLKDWMDKVKSKWTHNAVSMTESWMETGLRLRAISRGIKWGFPIPKKGYEDKVFYSWFDAPIGYIGITKEHEKDWEKWWKSKDTRLVQFMGKDNIPFHTIMFPSFLIGTDDGWTIMDTISSNEFLNYESGMFSKSRGVGIFGDNAMETGIPADVWRYYIMVNRPEKTDTEFTWDDFAAKLNNELVANIGNLVNRTLTFIKKFYDSKVPNGEVNEKLWNDIGLREKVVGELFEEIKLKDALREIMNISKEGNGFFQEQEPWKTLKEDKDKADHAIFNLVNLVKDLAIMISPFLPDTSKEIFKQLNIEEKNWSDLSKLSVKGGHEIKKGEVLFNKIEEKEVKEFKLKFAGKQVKEETVPENVFPADLRVAEIKEVKDHPEAEKLYIMQIKVGDEDRQIVAGIKNYYDQDSLIGKKIVVVYNLQPAKLRGYDSKGMLLAVANKGEVKILSSELNSGDKITVEGLETYDKEINIKEFSNLKLKVRDNKVYFKDKELKEIISPLEKGKVE
ncbi:methionine--tRNA ligase [Nanoarchaeota archaeon]